MFVRRRSSLSVSMSMSVSLFSSWFFFLYFTTTLFIGLNHCRWTKLLIHISIFFRYKFNFQDQYQLRPNGVSFFFFIQLYWIKARHMYANIVSVLLRVLAFCHFFWRTQYSYGDSWIFTTVLQHTVRCWNVWNFRCFLMCVYVVMQLLDDGCILWCRYFVLCVFFLSFASSSSIFHWHKI